MLVLTSFICRQVTRDGKINQTENIVSEHCVFVLQYIFLKLFLHFLFDHQNELNNDYAIIAGLEMTTYLSSF